MIEPTWIRLNKHLINANNIAGFSLDWNYENKCNEITIHFPSLSYVLYIGTEVECQDILNRIQNIFGAVWQISIGTDKGEISHIEASK